MIRKCKFLIDCRLFFPIVTGILSRVAALVFPPFSLKFSSRPPQFFCGFSRNIFLFFVGKRLYCDYKNTKLERRLYKNVWLRFESH